MNLKVVYLYAGPRAEFYKEFKKGNASDLQLVGLNHMVNHGVDAAFMENRITEFLRKISFNLVQLPILFNFRKYDVIFAGSGFFTLFVMKYVFRIKSTKWVVYNTYLSNLFKRNQKGFKAWVIKKAVFSADAVVSPSLAQQDFLANMKLPQEKNLYVPYGIDSTFYDNDTREAEINERYIFSSGRDVGRDYNTLFEAVKDLPVHLIVAASPKNMKNVKYVPSNVEVLFLKRNETQPYLKGAAFVVTTTISEDKMTGSDCSGQYSLLETMLFGKAIITTERETLNGYFTSGTEGIDVPPGDVAKLREAIMLLWDNPEKARTMGEGSRKKMRSELTMDNFAGNLAKIFYDVTKR